MQATNVKQAGLEFEGLDWLPIIDGNVIILHDSKIATVLKSFFLSHFDIESLLNALG